jgi:hypothetical protein
MQRWFNRVVLSRRWLTFVVMGLAFFLFGAAQQLIELLVTGYVSMMAYVVFKVCEYRLVHDLTGPPISGRSA